MMKPLRLLLRAKTVPCPVSLSDGRDPRINALSISGVAMNQASTHATSRPMAASWLNQEKRVQLRCCR
jgi:hypothetical protein